MGHFLFIVLHLLAILFAGVGLFITIPLHIIYSFQANKAANLEADRPTPQTHVRCPDCKELVRKDAVKCKHCGAGLVPINN